MLATSEPSVPHSLNSIYPPHRYTHSIPYRQYCNVPDATKMERFACSPSSSKTEHVPSQWGRRRSEDNMKVGDIYTGDERGTQPATLTLAFTTPLLPTSGARFLPHSGANRRDLCCPPRSSGVPVVSLDAGATRWRSREVPRSWKGGGRVRWWDVATPREETSQGEGWTKGTPGGVNPENVSDEDGDTLLSGRAEHQSGSRRTGASLSLPLSPSTLSLHPCSFPSFFSLPHSSWRGRGTEPYGGARAGLLRGETLPRRSVFSDQTARQYGPS